MTENIKQDINFLEYPMWMQNERFAPDVVKWTDQEGYVFSCTSGTPTKVDMIFLYFLLLECQKQNWFNELSFSRYQILKSCGITPSKKKYQRLEESLEKWKFTGIKFSGKFYNGVEYETLSFGIINDWNIQKDDKKIRIELNKFWIQKIQRSEFFKYISFNQMKQLRSPLALRLYEILTKTFYTRDTWEVGVLKLAAKIPMTEKYFSDIVKKIIPATKRISDKTELNIKVQVVKQGRGKGKFIFTRKLDQKIKEKSRQKLIPTDFIGQPEPPREDFLIPQEIMEQIPEQWRQDAQGMALEIIQKSGVDDLVDCIQFVNDNITEGKQLKSGYGAYLRWAYENGQQARATRNADRKAKDQAKKTIQAQNDAAIKTQAKLDAKRAEQERAGKETQDSIKALFAEQLVALDVFIDGQNLTKVARQRFNKGSRTMLRREYLEDYIKALK